MKKKVSAPNRFHRPDPERTQPNRGRLDAFAGARPKGNRHSGRGWDDESDADDPAEDGMRAADRVVERHLRDRRRGEGWYDPRGSDSPFGFPLRGRRGDNAVEQMIRIYLDLMNYLVSMIGSGPLGSMRRPLGRHPFPEGFAQRGNDRVTRVSVEIISKQPATAILDMEAPRHASLAVKPLHAIDRRKPSIKKVSLDMRHHRATLTLTIPPTQPTGVYTGNIVDDETEEEYGTLTVRVGAHHPESEDE